MPTTAPPVLRNRAENPGKVPGCSCAEGFLFCRASPSPRPAPNLLGQLRNSPARSLAPVGSAPGAGAPCWPWDGCAAPRGRTAQPGLQGHFVLSHTPGWVWGVPRPPHIHGAGGGGGHQGLHGTSWGWRGRPFGTVGSMLTDLVDHKWNGGMV